MRCILVGLGGRARSWLNVLREHQDVELVGFVEPSPQNRERATRQWEVPEQAVFTSLSEAAKACEADFVMDATPPAIHEQVALAAFEAGLHVLGEKPMSNSYAAGRRIVEAGRQAGLRHMITQNYRFGALPRTSRRLVEAGEIGTPGQLDVTFYMAWADSPGSHYVTEPYMFLTDMGIHHFDLMRYLLAADPESVQTISWNLPWGWHQGDASHVVVFRFPGNLMATHRGMGCTLGKMTSYNAEWRIEGPGGSLTWEQDKIFLTHDHRTDKKRREEIPTDKQAHGGQMAILVEFLAAVGADRAPECSAADNIKSMAMVFGAVRSAEEKREVALAELE